MASSEYFYKITSQEANLITKNIYHITPDYFEQRSYKNVCTPGDFSEYTGEKDLKWSNIIKTLDDSKIDKDVKQILKEGVQNLEKAGFNYNLSVLNYNLKNLDVIYEDPQVMQEAFAGGMFEAKGSKVTIGKDLDLKSDYGKK